MAVGGFTDERRTPLYRKRKPIPALVIVGLLLVAAVVVWIKVINRADDINAAVACPRAGGPSSTGQTLSHDALDKITPAPPNQVQIKVLNAGNRAGAAAQVSTALVDLGFQRAAAPSEDPLYPKKNMNCQGQLRFGANGEAAARTLSLVMPCTQLIRDNRQDATVDVAVGTKFSQVQPNGDARQVLRQLASWSASHPAQQGGQQAQGSLHPQISPDLLSNAAAATC